MKVKVFRIRLNQENQMQDQEELNAFMETVAVRKTSVELINDTSTYWSILVFYEDKTSLTEKKSSNKLAVNSFDELTVEEKHIYNLLKQWREDKANQMNVLNFVIAHNVDLLAIAKYKPETLEELAKIRGFGPYKIAKYGDDIIALLNSV